MSSMWRGLACATAAGLCLVACNALLDIDHIDFADDPSAATVGGGAAGGGGASQASSAATGGGGVGGQPPASPEDCTNGLDDNADGLIDCEDPLCTCVETAPANWLGPVALSTTAMLQACPVDWPTEERQGGGGTLMAPDASCSACGCGNPQGLGCDLPSLRGSSNSSCNSSAGSHNFSGANNCEAVAGSAWLSVERTTPSVTGSCSPNGGAPTIQPPTWTETATVCGDVDQSNSCAASSVCVPVPPAPFLQQICIYRNSGGQCPPGPYSERHEFFGVVNDSRDCSGCSCGAPQANCTGTTTTYANANCTTPIASAPNDGSCDPDSDVHGAVWAPDPINGTGNCNPSGGSPTGSASGGNPFLVCCMP